MITPQTHPSLPWRRLVGGPYNYPWIVFAVTAGRSSPAHIYMFNERTGFAQDRPCSAPDRAARWAVHFAQQHGG